MYTPEEVERLAFRADWMRDSELKRGEAAEMLRAYAATLKAAQGGVTDQLVIRVWSGYIESRDAAMAAGGSKDPLVHMRAALEAALSAQHGYDVGWKIRGVTAYDEAKRKGYRHPECVEAAIKAAPPAQQGPGVAWDARGGSLWLDREQWGVVIDALIEHRASAAKRKNGNPDSTSDVRADECGDLIGKITSAAKSITAPPAQPAERVDDPMLAAIERLRLALGELSQDADALTIIATAETRVRRLSAQPAERVPGEMKADLPPGYRMASRDGEYWPLFGDAYATERAFPTRELAALAAWKQAHDRLDRNMASIRQLAASHAPSPARGDK